MSQFLFQVQYYSTESWASSLNMHSLTSAAHSQLFAFSVVVALLISCILRKVSENWRLLSIEFQLHRLPTVHT